MGKMLLLAPGILMAASISGAAFAQGVQASSTQAASVQAASAPMSSVATAAGPPISDQQLSQQLGPALGLVASQAQQLIGVGGQGMQGGQAAAQPGASQPGGQVNGTAGAPAQMGLGGLSLGLVPTPHS